MIENEIELSFILQICRLHRGCESAWTYEVKEVKFVSRNVSGVRFWTQRLEANSNNTITVLMTQLSLRKKQTRIKWIKLGGKSPPGKEKMEVVLNALEKSKRVARRRELKQRQYFESNAVFSRQRARHHDANHILLWCPFAQGDGFNWYCHKET